MATSELTALTAGGCLCGAVRYAFNGAPRWTGHCHCRSCRKHSGAAVASFVGVALDVFRWTDGEPARHASSPGVSRCFCANCGTPLSYWAERWPDEIHLYLGTLDRPESVRPAFHVHTAEQLPWLHIADGLPRHAGSADS